VTETATRPRRAGLGAAALIGAFVPAVWSLVLVAVVGTSTGDDSFESGLITLSLIVLPVVSLVVVVLAVAALVSNNWIGRILAIVGIVLLVAQGIFLGLALASGIA